MDALKPRSFLTNLAVQYFNVRQRGSPCDDRRIKPFSFFGSPIGSTPRTTKRHKYTLHSVTVSGHCDCSGDEVRLNDAATSSIPQS